MPTLFYYGLCPSSRFVQLALGEIGVEFEPEEKRPWEWDADFATINPAGTLPVVIDMARIPLVGSYVITEYLAEVAPTLESERPQMELFTDEPALNGEIRRLVDWFMVKFHKDVSGLLLDEMVIKGLSGGGEPDMDILRSGRENLKYHLDYMRYLLTQKPWLAGEKASLADLAAAAQISAMDYIAHIKWDDVPEVKEWYGRMKSRPSFRPLLAARIAGHMPPAYYKELDF